MARLLSLFTRLWFLTLLGVLALSAIVWFEGPLLAFNGHVPLESIGARLWLIVFFLLLWGLWLLLRAWRAWRANRALVKAMAAESAPPAGPQDVARSRSAEEVKALEQRFAEALKLLKKGGIGSRFGQQYLYATPWYMIVGAPGAGKTTALVNSGLRFALQDQRSVAGDGTLIDGKKLSVRGVGGTRDCDWWFTDQAVLLDTAGRYTTQDSERAVDQAAWKGFLQLLKASRPRRPINGMILAVSVTDLLQQDAAARSAQAAQIRARIQELYGELGVRCPIYVLVTKTDLLAGFTQFFDALGEGERGQVWGFTWPLDPDGRIAEDPLAGFAEQFAALEQRLNSQLIERVQHERDPVRRALVYGFPQQFASLKPLLQTFLGEVFAATRYEQKPWVRGVYFTSGTQEGNPIDRVAGAVSAAFGLRRIAPPLQAGRGRSFFLTRLLLEVVVQEAGLAGANPKVERRRLWLQRAALAGAAAFLLLAVLLFSVSYGRNAAYVAEVAEKTRAAQELAHALTPQQTSILDTLPLLDAVRNLPGGFADRDKGTPWLMGFGLYQGDKLGSEAEENYHRLLNEALMPRLKARLAGELHAAATTGANPELLYEGLRVYLMLHDRSHFDPAAVQAWLAYDLKHYPVPGATADQLAALGEHFNALADREYLDFTQPLDQDVIDEARRNLARLTPAQRAYSRLVREFQRSRLPEITVISAAGVDAPIVLRRQSNASLNTGVPGLFTVAGYRAFMPRSATAVAELSKDVWVLGQDQAVNADVQAGNRLTEEVVRLYYDDYIRRWDSLLGDVAVVPFSSPEQGSRVLGLLAGPESPLRKFLQVASRETKLAGVPTGKSVTDKVRDTLKDATSSLESVLGGETPAAAGAGPTATPVDIHFEALHRWVDGGGGAPGSAPLDRTLAKVGDVKVALDAAASARQAGQPPPPSAALPALAAEAGSGGPPVLDNAVREMVNSASASTLGGERPRLSALWAASVAPLCQQAISNRYPIYPKATDEVPQEDFGRLFSPGGVLDDFVQRNLAPYIDNSGPTWRWRPVNNVSLGIPDEVLRDLQRAAVIRDAMFRGGHTPALRFDLRPVSLDKGLTQFTLELDGQVLTVNAASAARPVTFNWPASGSNSVAHVEVAPAGAGGGGFTVQGPWALFRLLDRGTLTRSPQRERFTLTFDFEGRKVVLELIASSVQNPFQLDALTQFRCPARL